MDNKNIQLLVINILCVICILVFSIYHIADEKPYTTEENENKNNSEIIVFKCLLSLDIIYLFAIICLFVLSKFIKINIDWTKKKFISIFICCFAIVCTSISWDISARNNDENGEREAAKFITIINFILLLKLFEI